ncbi:protein diaphanous homolog 3 isoform X1 [Tachysurus ichikawai]
MWRNRAQESRGLAPLITPTAQNINFSSARALTSKEAYYESEAHSSAAHRSAHRPEREQEKERARERESEKEQTPPSCSANGETDVEALLARLRAL